jgi:hypothetical protein
MLSMLLAIKAARNVEKQTGRDSDGMGRCEKV